MRKRPVFRTRLCIAVVFMLCSIAALAYYVFLLTLPGGRNFGLTLVGIHSIIFLIFGLAVALKHISLLPDRIWKISKIIILVFFFWLGSFVLVSCLVMANSCDTAMERPGYVLILGAGLDGDKPKNLLQRRLETGYNYLRVYPDVPVIVSGGQGPGETISEALAMQNYLLDRGIERGRIICEDCSQSTRENFLYTSRLLEKTNAPSPVHILIVTSDFHIFRSKILAERNGFIYGTKKAPTPGYLLPVNLLREFFALGKSLILDR